MDRTFIFLLIFSFFLSLQAYIAGTNNLSIQNQIENFRDNSFPESFLYSHQHLIQKSIRTNYFNEVKLSILRMKKSSSLIPRKIIFSRE